VTSNEARTLPEHATCATHEHYLLSCADYEELLAESGGGCQICNFPADQMPQKRLYIDHDGHLWAVRGLLCIRCNSGLGDYRHPTPDGAEEFLANAWYLRKLAERGLTLDAPEPPPGSVVRDYRGAHWHRSLTRSGSEHWAPIRGAIRRSRTWDQMYRLCGPLSMRVVGTWDGEDWDALYRDFPPDPGPAKPPGRAALERRIAKALELVRGREWHPREHEAVEALISTLTGS
jgi:hypothetical protein